MKKIRLTTAQSLLKFLEQQYVEIDGIETPFVKGVFGIFGHGNVTGLGEALEYGKTSLTYLQGHNEQGMVHAATAFAKASNRLQIFACTSSIGPGALNMVTGAATATINRIPVLLLPGDIFACRQPDPVLQQLEVGHDYTISVNDCFKPVSRYFDRILRAEQLMQALINAFRVLTDPIDTGAVTIALPQDVQTEAYDFPASFFDKKIHYIDRMRLSTRAVRYAVDKLLHAKNPFIVAGGGVHYAYASEVLRHFSNEFKIPVAETQAGKSAMNASHPMSVGGIGVTGTETANKLAKEADVILVIGSRLSDFTTSSKSGFKHPSLSLLHLNISAMDANKMDGTPLLGDARSGLIAIAEGLRAHQYQTSMHYQNKIQSLRASWQREIDRLYQLPASEGNTQTAVLGTLNQFITSHDIIVAAAGSLPGDLHRLWQCEKAGSYHLEYGFSCMGYEVAGGLGVKLAHPQSEVYVFVGDGSYLMLHSELFTAIQEKIKINIILFNNQGYQCIHHLQRSHGSQGFGNEFRYRCHDTKQLKGNPIVIDFAKYAASLGAMTFHAKNTQEFSQALINARESTVSTLIEVPVLPGTMSNGYDTFWRVDVAECSTEHKVTEAYQQAQKKLNEVKLY